MSAGRRGCAGESPEPQTEGERTPLRLFCSPFPVPPPTHAPKEFVEVRGRKRKEAPRSERTQPAGSPALGGCVCSLGSRRGPGVTTAHRPGMGFADPTQWASQTSFLSFPSFAPNAAGSALGTSADAEGVSEDPAGFLGFFLHVPLILRSGWLPLPPSRRFTGSPKD